MINNVRHIVSENPSTEIWKFLRFFLDIDYTSEQIRKIHNIDAKKQKENVRKQALQLSYCIRQAEEYFKASNYVDLSTRPLLLYYGAVNLSQALILLRRDGNFSFDVRRKNKKHNHHGLNLLRGPLEINKYTNIEDFYKMLQCEVNKNNNMPWGQFPLFYETLVPYVFEADVEIHKNGNSTYIKKKIPFNSSDYLPIDLFVERFKSLNAFDLIKCIPDLYYDLIEMNIFPGLCRGNIRIKNTDFYKKNNDKNEFIKCVEECAFFLDDIMVKDKDYLLNYYKHFDPEIKLKTDLGVNLHLFRTREYTGSQEVYYPEIVENIIGNKFYILRPDEYIVEPVAIFILLYCLGMVSRYYPDIWMNAIDNNIKIFEITNSLLNIVFRKFPNYILNQMTHMKYSINS